MPKQSTSVRTTRSTKARPASSRRASTAGTTQSTRTTSARPASTTRGKSAPKRGFAAMSLQKRREIARKGVRARRAG